MRVSEAFPSKYLKAEVDVMEGEPITVTISGVDVQDFDDNGRKQSKFVISFEELSKSLVANKTNSMTLSKLLGDESDDWVGRRITLQSVEVQFKDEMVPSIRVKSKLPIERTNRGTGKSTQAPTGPGKAVPMGAGGGKIPTNMVTETEFEDSSNPPF